MFYFRSIHLLSNIQYARKEIRMMNITSILFCAKKVYDSFILFYFTTLLSGKVVCTLYLNLTFKISKEHYNFIEYKIRSDIYLLCYQFILNSTWNLQKSKTNFLIEKVKVKFSKIFLIKVKYSKNVRKEKERNTSLKFKILEKQKKIYRYSSSFFLRIKLTKKSYCKNFISMHNGDLFQTTTFES